ncbi:molybdate ABC transporter substrate-binding protein [Gorillibacterium timonense]|uniref:molybdate ABC transporter substrate-binding protein n=1 Tax=Gorillibacterium timonense TaxID=1689269 RepID=UPI00071C985D|nr:molybdate ABC transporter substrate-binding protein [Gorillibacterium timonense]
MKNRNPLLVMLLLSLALLLGLTGCGKSSDSAASASPSASASTAPTDSPSVSPSLAPSESASPTVAPAGDKVQLIVSAAASLTESLEEIKPIYEASHPGVTLAFNFGASGTLQKQIEQGAKADLFLSAGAKQMKALVEGKFIDSTTQKNLLLNELVVVVPSEGGKTVASLEDLKDAGFKKLAVGTPESVPAGSYTKETLEKASLWDALQPKMVFTKDVKQVLNYVETGNTEAGFVYKTDALASTKAKIAYTVDNSAHSPITYPIGIIQATEHRTEADALCAYLTSQEAIDIFVKHGFLAAE